MKIYSFPGRPAGEVKVVFETAEIRKKFDAIGEAMFLLETFIYVKDNGRIESHG